MYPTPRWKIVLHWILILLAILILISVWSSQRSVIMMAFQFESSHLGSDSEGGAFFWHLFGLFMGFVMIGWHFVPFSLWSIGYIIRKDPELLKRKLHLLLLTIFGVSILLSILLFLISMGLFPS